jgi:hypothetical protein
MNRKFYRQVESHLNAERLDAYRRDGADEATTMARYLLNLALCESLYAPLQMAEVTLRNALHESLSSRAGDVAWYDSLPLPRWQSQQILDAKQRLQKMHKPLTAGRIVAELTFGFWVGFLTKPHMTSGLAYYIAKTAFAQAPKPERGVPKLAAQWQQVRNLRNRVFHHERILHWHDLEAQHNEILQLIGWINPELEQLTRMLDRFTTVRTDGLSPWLERLQSNWPNEKFNPTV